MRSRHVGVNLHYPPVHLQPFYREGFNPGDFPVAEAYAQRAITLPFTPDCISEMSVMLPVCCWS